MKRPALLLMTALSSTAVTARAQQDSLFADSLLDRAVRLATEGATRSSRLVKTR